MKKENKRWAKTKKIGKLKFSIIYGLLFSCVSSVFFILYQELTKAEPHYDDYIFMLSLFFIVGPFWSVGFWNAMNKKYL
jgi:O-antigen/teichoic acid export membrane protein